MPRRPLRNLRFSERSVCLGEQTLVMGILNVTPDSFSDGGRFLDAERAIARGLDLAKQGADWIDVGGESTRPGAEPITVEVELRRVLPVITGLHRKRPSLPISIDTTKAEVAEAAVRAGASIINDVSGLRFDPRIAKVAQRYRTGLVLMHLRGTPQTMQKMPFTRSVWRSIREGLARSIRSALAAGVKRSQLVIDPGLGFGKSRRQNFEILAQLGRLQSFRLPILVGTSRKSFVQAIGSGEGFESGKRTRSAWRLADGSGALRAPAGGQPAPAVSGSPPLLGGDAAAVVASILAGAHIVRVHDVAAMLPAVRIADAILASQR